MPPLGGGSRRNIAMILVRKKNDGSTRRWKKVWWYVRTWQTDGQTPHDSIGHACIASRCNKRTNCTQIYLILQKFYEHDCWNLYHYEEVCKVMTSVTAQRTSSSAVAKRPRDASCLSVVSFNIPTAQFFTSYCGFRFTSAENYIKFCSAVSYCIRRCPTKTSRTNTPRS